MGAANAMAAYRKYAGKVPATSLQCLVYMALVSVDADRDPWFGLGHHALAEHALGRPSPISRADIKAVERAMAPLAEKGAITVDRKAAVRRDGSNTARYRLNLTGAIETQGPAARPPENGGREAAEKGTEDPPRPPETGPHAPRKTGSRPPETVPTPPEKRGTKEYEEYEERENQEEEIAVRTDLTDARAPEAVNKPEISSPTPEPAEPPPATGAPPAQRQASRPPPPPGMCEYHPAFRAGTNGWGKPHCDLCRTQGRPNLTVLKGGVA